MTHLAHGGLHVTNLALGGQHVTHLALGGQHVTQLALGGQHVTSSIWGPARDTPSIWGPAHTAIHLDHGSQHVTFDDQQVAHYIFRSPMTFSTERTVCWIWGA